MWFFWGGFPEQQRLNSFSCRKINGAGLFLWCHSRTERGHGDASRTVCPAGSGQACSAVALHTAAANKFFRSKKSFSDERWILTGEQNSPHSWTVLTWTTAVTMSLLSGKVGVVDKIKVSCTRENFKNTTLEVCVYIGDVCHSKWSKSALCCDWSLKFFTFWPC